MQVTHRPPKPTVSRTLEALQTVAEIAITLIGFVGMFIAFRSERASTSRAELTDFLQSAIGAVAFAFLPLILNGILQERTLWRVSCGLFGLFHLSIWVLSIREQLSVRRFSGAEWAFAGASLLVISLKIAVGAGFLVTYGFQIYLLGLVWLILNCVIGFYGFMARSLWGN